MSPAIHTVNQGWCDVLEDFIRAGTHLTIMEQGVAVVWLIILGAASILKLLIQTQIS